MAIWYCHRMFRSLCVIAAMSAPVLADGRSGGGGAHGTHGGGRATGPAGSVAASKGTTTPPVQSARPVYTGTGGARGRVHRSGGAEYTGGYAYYGSDDTGYDGEPVAAADGGHYYIPLDDDAGLDQPRVSEAPHVAVDCLDISVAHPSSRSRGIVIAYDVRNRCDAPVAVDFGSTVVASRTYDDQPTWLTAFDPQHALGAFWLAPLGATSATITYTAQTSTTGICVDAASLAGRNDPRWLCID